MSYSNPHWGQGLNAEQPQLAHRLWEKGFKRQSLKEVPFLVWLVEQGVSSLEMNRFV